MERVERDRIAKRVYVGECAGSRSVGMSRKRWKGREGVAVLFSDVWHSAVIDRLVETWVKGEK